MNFLIFASLTAAAHANWWGLGENQWWNEAYNPGVDVIPSVFDTPLFPTGYKEVFQSMFPDLPTLPFSLYSHGLEFDGQAYPELNVKLADVTAAMGEHLALVEVNGTAKPAALYFQEAVKLDSFDDFAKFSFNLREQSVQGTDTQNVIEQATKSFTDSDVADAQFLNSLLGISPYNGLLALKKVTREMVDTRLQYIFPDYDFSSLDAGYFVLDTEIMAAVKPHSPGTFGAKYSVGALTILKRDSETKKLLPKLMKITMLNDRESAIPDVNIYSKENSTDSAWRMGLLAAKSSFTQWGVVVAHILPMHVTSGALQQSLYNNVDPRHKFRKFLEPFAKYTMQFGNFVLLNAVSLDAFPYTNDAPNMENFMGVFDAWSKMYKDMPLSEQLPSAFLAKQGLVEEDFTDKKAWDLLPTAQHAIRIEKSTKNFASDMVSAIYNSNYEIQNDLQLQNFIKSCKEQGNLKSLTNNEDGELRTKRELVKIINTYFYNNLYHAFSRLGEFSEGAHFVPNQIPSLNSNMFIKKDPNTYNFSDEEILEHMPPTNILATYISFVYFFTKTDTKESIVDSRNLFNDGNIFTFRDAIQRRACDNLSIEIKKIVEDEMQFKEPPFTCGVRNSFDCIITYSNAVRNDDMNSFSERCADTKFQRRCALCCASFENEKREKVEERTSRIPRNIES